MKSAKKILFIATAALLFRLLPSTVAAQTNQFIQVADLNRSDTTYKFGSSDDRIFTNGQQLWFNGNITNGTYSASGICVYENGLARLIHPSARLSPYVLFIDSACIATRPTSGYTSLWLERYGPAASDTITLDFFQFDQAISIYHNFLPLVPNIIYVKKAIEGAGNSLWKVDAHGGAPQQIIDTWPGHNDDPQLLANGDDMVYFTSKVDGNINLWRTDGTTEGTIQLTFGPNTWSANLHPETAKTIGNRLFVIATPPDATPILLTSLGMPESTETIAIQQALPVQTELKSMIAGSRYLFTLPHTQWGVEWWSVGIDTIAPHFLKDITTGAGNSNFAWNRYGKSVLNGYFYFQKGLQLWRTNGTTEQTEQVAGLQNDMYLMGATDSLVLIFRQNGGTAGPFEVEIWTYNGTGNEIYHTGTIDGYFWISNGQIPGGTVGNKALFFPNVFMYETSGSPDQTHIVAGINQNATFHSSPGQFSSTLNGEVFFNTHAPDLRNIWKINALPPFHPQGLTHPAGHYQGVFNGGDKVFWIELPNLAHSMDSNDVISDGVVNAPAQYFHAHNNRLYYVFNGLVCSYDGITNDTVYQPPAGRNVTFCTKIGTSLILLTDSAGQNAEVWRINLSQSTYAPKFYRAFAGLSPQIIPGGVNRRIGLQWNEPNGQARLSISGFDDMIIPSSPKPPGGIEAIEGDGVYVLSAKNTAQNHQLIYRENGGFNVVLSEWPALSVYSDLQTDYTDRLIGFPNGAVVFGAGDTDGIELWTSAGTPETTTLLKDINPNGPSSPDNWTPYNDSIWLFTAFDGLGAAWWKTNGTPEGTQKLIDLPAITFPATGLTAVSDAALLQGNRLFFSMDDGLTGAEPWVVLLLDSLVTPALLLPENDMTVRIFPNPTVDFFTVECEGEFGPTATLQIFDAQGQPVSSPLTPDQYEGDSSRWRVERPLRAGLYYAVVQAGRYRSVAKVMRVK